GPPVSETGALLITPRSNGPAFALRFGAADSARQPKPWRRLVAREGSAPPTSGCRPDAILFHHRAGTGCRGWIRTSILAFKGRCPPVRRPGKVGGVGGSCNLTTPD